MGSRWKGKYLLGLLSKGKSLPLTVRRGIEGMHRRVTGHMNCWKVEWKDKWVKGLFEGWLDR
jgi:hypothetical protein